MVAEWVSAVAEAITAIGVVFAYLQLKESHSAVLKDHERSRREGAVQYLLEFTKSVTRQMAAASRLVDRLDVNTCSRIEKREEAAISKEHFKELLACFTADTTFREDGNCYLLTTQQSAEVRGLVVTYLNLLETILCAWLYSSVDRELIEKQFGYLRKRHDGRNMMQNFRAALGIEHHPATEAFEKHLDEVNRQKGKSPI
jgi:hypothetical protein